MNNKFILDATTALCNLGGYAWETIKHIVKVIVFFASVLVIAVAVGAAIMHYPLYSMIALVVGIVGTAFVIEFKTVRWIREQEEKHNLAQPEYKEQL